MTFVADKKWYELSYVRAANGNKAIRLYVIRCHTCTEKKAFKPNTLSDEKLRRNLIREGWSLGRYLNQHLCPLCNIKQPNAKAQDDYWTRSFLVEAWNTSNETERGIFLDYLSWLNIAIENNLLVEMKTETLVDRFVSGTVEERTKLLDYLQQATIAEPHKPLIGHWKAATGAERDAILASYRGAAPMSVIEDVARLRAVDVSHIAQAAHAAYVAHVDKPTITRVAPAPGTMTKSEFAREIGVQPCTVSGYLREGLPERSDRRLDRDVAMAWIEERRAIRINGDRLAATPSEGPPIDVNDDDALAEVAKRLFK